MTFLEMFKTFFEVIEKFLLKISFMPYLKKVKSNLNLYKSSIEKIETENEISKLNIESEIRSKVENIELRGSGWRFIEYFSMRVLPFEGQLAEGASNVKLPIENQAIIITENKDKLCGIDSILAFLHPPRDNPNRVSNYTKYITYYY